MLFAGLSVDIAIKLGPDIVCLYFKASKAIIKKRVFFGSDMPDIKCLFPSHCRFVKRLVITTSRGKYCKSFLFKRAHILDIHPAHINYERLKKRS